MIDQPRFNGISTDVFKMMFPICLIPDSMVRKTRLPNIQFPIKFSLRTERESALDELDCFLQSVNRHNQQVHMVRHDDISVQ